MSLISRQYIYLHGFASSPTSTKARFFQTRFARRGLSLQIPDLNGGNFSGLTLSRQIEQVGREFLSSPTPTTIIGSSLGGLTAAWLAEKYKQVEKLILLAPAFGFLPLWLSYLGETTVNNWRESGFISVYHYGEARALPLKYDFVTDLNNYPEDNLKREVPTIILHGKRDDVIPLRHSIDYGGRRSWVKLYKLDSDHHLTDVMETIWEIVAPDM